MTATPEAPTQDIRVVLVDAGGVLVGALPYLTIPTDWWPSTPPVIEAVRRATGARVEVLRLLDVEVPRGAGPKPRGGRVTYLAQLVSGSVPAGLEPYDGDLSAHSLRLGFAKPGGPAAELEWVRTQLAQRGIDLAASHQERTSNLSGVWRLDTSVGTLWHKAVPPFFAHEGAMITALARSHPDWVPRLVATEPGRILVHDFDGIDQWQAPEPVMRKVVNQLVAMQFEWIGRDAELLSMGMPDWRRGPFEALAVDVVERHRAEVGSELHAELDALIDELPARFDTLDASGIPATFVHGDCHPGNTSLRADGNVTIFDWGDTGLGCPLFDLPALERGVAPGVEALVPGMLCEAWHTHMPASNPELALSAMRPVAALRQAVIYRQFMDRIEPSEHVYHRADPCERLTDAVEQRRRHPLR